LVDDDILIARSYQKRLVDKGHEVTYAADGEEALRVADGSHHLIILDIVMPKLDGWEVLTKIKEDQKVAHIPVVIFTILEGEEHRARAKSLGAHAFVNKANDDLFAAIEKIFEEAQS